MILAEDLKRAVNIVEVICDYTKLRQSGVTVRTVQLGFSDRLRSFVVSSRTTNAI